MAFGLESLLRQQDHIVARRQALGFLAQAKLDAMLGRDWQILLPGVYAAFTGLITDRHRLRAALLYAGETAMLNDTHALRHHKVPYLPNDPFVRLLVDASVQRASRDFVVIRRTTRLPRALQLDGLPTAPADRAVAELVRREPDLRVGLAVAAAALQRHKLTLEQLVFEARHGPARGRPRLLRVTDQLIAGSRSAPEEDLRQLVIASSVLPAPLWNPLIELPGGIKISPDGLFVDAGLIYEVNGRDPHAPLEAGEDAFEDMQRRHDVLTTGGFIALHFTPRRITREGPAVLDQLERNYLRYAGRGMPAGVKILRAGPPGVPSNAALPHDRAG